MPNGYAKVGRDGKTWLAHRYAWTKLVGDIPDGQLVLHKCDNRVCCRPSHLFLGTHQDNTQDMISKGRHNWSGHRAGKWRERIPRKLTAEQKEQIRALRLKDGLPLAVIAARFGVVFQHVSKVAKGQR